MCVVRRPTSLVPCRISLSSLVRCPYPVSFWPIADCLTVTCLLAFNFICDALPPTSLLLPLPISLLVFKEAAELDFALACIVPLLLAPPFPVFPFFPSCSCALIYMLELSLQRLAISIVVLLSPFAKGRVSSDLCAYAKDLMTLA